MKPSDAFARIQHISCLGLTSEIAIPAMLEVFESVVASSNSDFTWTHPDGSVRNIYGRSLDPGSIEVMINHSNLMRRPGEVSFETHSRSPLAWGNMAYFRSLANIERTVAYNEIWKPNAFEQFIDLIIRDETGTRGVAFIGRSARERPFTPAEQRRLVTLRSWFIHALDTRPDEETTVVDTGEEAVLLCDGAGRIVQMGPNAAGLVMYAGNGRIAPGAVIAGVGDALPETVRRVCRDLARILSGRLSRPPSARLKTLFGTFNFRAHGLGAGLPGGGEQGLIAVVIRRALPFPLMLHNRVAEMPLTARQRQVAVAIGLGRSPDMVQADLGLSPGTYRRHVEDIHGRLEVRTRAELMAALMGGRIGHAA